MSKTYGQQMNEVLALNTKEEAEAWLAAEVQDWLRSPELQKRPEPERTPEWCRKTIISNIGYMAGYYDDSVAQKVYDLLGSTHPIFGDPGYHKTVSATQAFEAGKKMAVNTQGARS